MAREHTEGLETKKETEEMITDMQHGEMTEAKKKVFSRRERDRLAMWHVTMPHPLKITGKRHSENRSLFTIESLRPGFGELIGSALCQTLLTAIPGEAVEAISIGGVTNEDSSIPGVKEDVHQIRQNAEKIIANITDGYKIGCISISGPKTVTAGDIIGDDDLVIFNPEQPIATLLDGSVFSMEIIFNRGDRYRSSSDHKNNYSFMPIDLIYTNSSYSPVTKAEYCVENDADLNKYDRLKIDVNTNGSMLPSEAIDFACRILKAQFSCLIHDSEVYDWYESDEPYREPVRGANPFQLYDCPAKIDELDLSVRSYTCLKCAGIKRICDLSCLSKDELMQIPNFGPDLFEEICRKVKTYALTNYDFKESAFDFLFPNPDIDELNLSEQSLGCLKSEGISKLNDLMHLTKFELLEEESPNLGTELFEELCSKIKDYVLESSYYEEYLFPFLLEWEYSPKQGTLY